MDIHQDIQSIVKSVREGIDTASMHLLSRDVKVQIAALVLHDELKDLMAHPDVARDENAVALLRLKAHAVRVAALDVNQVCGGPK